MDVGVPIDLHQSALIAAASVVVSAVSFATILRDAWRVVPVRIVAACVAAYLVAVHARWAWGMYLESWPIAHEASIWAVVGLLPITLVAWSLPVAGLVWQLLRPRPHRVVAAATDDARPLVTRRQVAKAAASTVPLVALGTAGRGYSSGLRLPEVRPIPLAFPGLHSDLHGLTILHLSDLHLGFVRQTRHLEATLERLTVRPDLVVLTGDVADDLNQLERALRAVKALSPRLGVFSSLGNHEYLHDAPFARAAHRRAGVPLLVGDGASIAVGKTTLHVGGADDPVELHGDIGAFMHRTVAAAMRGAPKDAFRLLLSHRPEGFVPGALHGAHLTLSGHTHGGQIGFNGKSAFEPIWSERYLWGSFRRGTSRLYTTSGFGHWFPFRVGCPAEVPLITLGPAR
ncbi:metallophosphoesterase [Labilithrix luteola]|nr:metallophosphoesterase [Labilithrix luteola]